MFRFWLADKWGFPNVDLMLSMMSSKMLTEWSAYFRALEISKQSPDELAMKEQIRMMPHTINRSK